MKHLYKSYIYPFLKLIRTGNLAIIFLSQYLINYFILQNKSQFYPFDWDFLLLSLATVFVAAAGYIINDYYDIKIDMINHPERITIGKNFTRRWAIIFHIHFNFFALIIGFFLGFKILVILIGSIFLLWLYSNQLKRMPFFGNIVVALLIVMSIFLVCVFRNSVPLNAVFFMIFAFLINLVREVVKDMEDIKGDAKFSCRTLPIVWGIRKTKYLLYFIIGIFIGFYLIWEIRFNSFKFLYLDYCILVLTFGFTCLLAFADSKNNFQKLSLILKIIMVIGIVRVIL